MTDRKRILCVDDLETICRLVAMLLKEYEVVAVHTKAEGLVKASAEKFDMYLLDYYLPDGTGVELYSSIREFDPHTPALFMTSSDAIVNSQAEELGAQGVIEKYHFTEELPLAVNRLLRSNLG